MKIAKTRTVQAICEHVFRIVEMDKGAANKEVLQQSLVRLRMLLRRRRLREAEDVAYRILMEYQGVSKKESSHAAKN